MVLELKKLRKGFLVCFALALGTLLYRFCIFEEQPPSAKADRSNAVEVSAVGEDVSANVDFFTEYRLEREKLRSQYSDLLRDQMTGAASDELRKQAQENILKMMQDKQRETEMENLIKAKGFSDAVVVCRDQSASAIVRSSRLSQTEAMQIADIIRRIASIREENITVSAKP